MLTAPSGPPTALIAVASSSRSMHLTWQPPRSDQLNGILRHYVVTLVRSSSRAALLMRNVSSIQQATTISGLQPHMQYNCTVQAETVGLGPAAPSVQVTTPQDSEEFELSVILNYTLLFLSCATLSLSLSTPSLSFIYHFSFISIFSLPSFLLTLLVPTGPPQDITSQIVSPTTLNLSWSPPTEERRNGLIQLFTVSITELETRTLQTFTTPGESIIISNRHPFYRYSFTIAAETVIGRGPFSVTSTVHMPEAGEIRLLANCFVVVYML